MKFVKLMKVFITKYYEPIYFHVRSIFAEFARAIKKREIESPPKKWISMKWSGVLKTWNKVLAKINWFTVPWELKWRRPSPPVGKTTEQETSVLYSNLDKHSRVFYNFTNMITFGIWLYRTFNSNTLNPSVQWHQGTFPPPWWTY